MFVCAVSVYAYDVTLHAVDNQGDDEAYATCRIFALPDSINAKVVGVADSLGYYTASIDSLGTYRLFVEGAGTSAMTTRDFTLTTATPSLNLGDVVLTAVDQLNEVTVTAQRPLVVKKIDRIGYDVQADPQVHTLSTRDMLRNVPMVAVDADGNITVNGSSNFKVFKNGRPNNSMSKNAKEILAAIPASMIKTIEVITEPGAKYDAEGIGAILNIVTIDNTVIKGVMGTVSGGYDVWKRLSLANVFVSGQVDKVTISLNGGMQSLSSKATQNESETALNYLSGITDNSTQNMSNRGYVSWFNGEGSWEPNKKNLFNFELGGMYYNVKPKGTGSDAMLAADGQTISRYNYMVDYPKYAYFDFNGNVNYQLSTDRTGESLTLSYAVSTTDQNIKQYTEFSDVEGDLFNYTAMVGNSDLNFIEHTFQADWVRPFGKVHTLELGGKYILRRNLSNVDTEYTGWMTNNTEFKHITDVGALYAQYTATIKRVSLRAGLRYEYSRLKADFPDGSAEAFSSNLNDFVPSAAVSWSVNDANSLSFNYAARINRPGISYLDPTVSYAPTMVSSGNPALKSAYSNSLKLTYMYINKKVNFNISADYAFNNDNISRIQSADANGVVYRTYDNIGHERQLTFSGFVQWTMTPTTRVSLNGNVSYHKYSQDGMSLGRWMPIGSMNVNQTLPGKVQLGLAAYMYGGAVADVYNYYHSIGSKQVGYNVSVSRSFLKEDRLTVSVLGSDFIGNKCSKFEVRTVNGDYTGSAITGTHHGNLMFRLSYRFGSFGASVKKTAASIKNDDLVGRKQ
jgi:hypothetical protein